MMQVQATFIQISLAILPLAAKTPTQEKGLSFSQC